jgi:hypothetical protein
MDADDAFWAAKQVAHFTREEIRAIVETGRYRHEATVDHLTDALVGRRDKIVRAYLPHGGGLGRFRVEGGALAFANLLDHEAFGAHRASAAVSVTWHRFDNRRGRRARTLDTLSLDAQAQGRVAIPPTDARYLSAVLQRTGTETGATEVFLRRERRAEGSGGTAGERWTVVGLRRSTDGIPRGRPSWTKIPEALKKEPTAPAPPSRPLSVPTVQAGAP